MQEKYTAKINDLIALCHIIDNFEEFQKRLMPMLTNKHDWDLNDWKFIDKIWDISRGKPRIGARKVKKFYNENKMVIDTINQYSNITNFIFNNYKMGGASGKDFQFFYQYIIQHKENIEQILEILEKIQKLGFYDLEFNEDLDFTKIDYNTPTKFGGWFNYVDNIQVIPNYDENTIHYKTTNSNYEMPLMATPEDDFYEFHRTIVLNSLLFDSKRLPDSITKETIFDPLLEAKNAQKEQTKSIRNSVNLRLCVTDLETGMNNANYRIKKLDGVNKKEELKEALSGIRKYIETLKDLSQEYDDAISEQEPLLAPEVLENEEDLYLKRGF